METILLFGPLVGAIICGFSWRLIGEQAACVVATGLLFLSMLLSWVVFLGFDGETYTRSLFTWIESGSLFTDWAIRVDRLTAIMLIVITTVSALVHLYSFGYMAHDDNFKEGESYRPRFFAYLSFFTFAMLMLVTADNLAADVLRLGGRGRRLLPADRVLLPQALGQRCGDQGLRRQPGREISASCSASSRSSG
jgi:NADH-quinone oxidoreductase subunit L